MFDLAATGPRPDAVSGATMPPTAATCRRTLTQLSSQADATSVVRAAVDRLGRPDIQIAVGPHARRTRTSAGGGAPPPRLMQPLQIGADQVWLSHGIEILLPATAADNPPELVEALAYELAYHVLDRRGTFAYEPDGGHPQDSFERVVDRVGRLVPDAHRDDDGEPDAVGRHMVARLVARRARDEAAQLQHARPAGA